MTYEIEKGVPIPGRTFRCASAATYRFRDMEVGDSFLVPDIKKARSARVRARMISKETGRAFLSRKTIEGVRFWRTA